MSNSLKNSNCLFIGGPSGRDELFLEISKELEKRHKINTNFISLADGSEIFLESKGIKTSKINKILFEKRVKKIDISYLEDREKKYGLKLLDIWQIAAVRSKKRRKFSHTKVLAHLEYTLRRSENILTKNKFDFVFITGISGPAQVIIYKICNTLNIPILELTNARIPNRFTFDNFLTSKWPLIHSNYQINKKKGISKEDKKDALKFIESFREKPFKPDDSAPKKWDIKKIYKQIKYYFKVLSYRKRLPNLMQFIYPFMDKIMLNSSRFSMPKPYEKYVFFPLQTQPEASTSIRGKWFIDQINLIEKISKSVPCGYKVYVKEHVRNFSKRPKDFHKKLLEFPNVKLISPKANTIKIIEKSSLVFTITGTAGWESIIMQKPVVVFGEVFYAYFDEAIQLSNLTLLPKVIQKNLNKKTKLKDSVNCVSAMLKGSFKGIAALPGDCQNKSLSKENIQLLTNGIEKYIRQMKY